MIRLMFLTVLTGLLLSVAAGAVAEVDAATTAKESKPAYQAQPCDLPVASTAVAARLQCGTLKVQSPDGSQFQLAVVRKAATEPKAGAAPVLFLHGGPGGEMTRFIGLSESDFSPGHELIAIDMRGSGRSKPLFCPQLAAELTKALAESPDDNSFVQQRRAALLQCQQQMLAQGYSPQDFGTVQTVQDLELLREQLNVDKWHLYSESYGTVVALQYLAVAPKALVSVTLDSVYPPDELLTSFKLQQDQWLRQLDQLCQQQRGCASRFGAMSELFNRAISELTQRPLQLETSAGPLLLSPDKLRLAVMAAATAEQPLSLLPLWLQAVSQRNTALLKPWAEAMLQPSTIQFAAAMATECADRQRYYQQGRADSLEQSFGLPEGVCASFGVATGAAAGVEAGPVQVPQVPETAKVRTPVLLLAGGLDLFQPDSLVLSQWLGPHSQLVAVPGALHGVRGAAPCLRKMVGDFIRAPERFGPPGCLAEVAKPYLVTALEPNPTVATALASLQQAQPSALLLALVLSLLLSALLGVIWPVFAVLWFWLSGRPQPVCRIGLLSGASVLLSLAVWGALGMTLWQTLARRSAELWLGLPPDSQPWRLVIALTLLPVLVFCWWLARQQHWRQLLAQLALGAAVLLAVALQLLP
ncbi:alpha/beta fold hydrolase [Rheinheimera texasensis]|uniref:alpha/beta fold hydrolase n=1 Tax=Rheinheimera texasensis TaxID=306205 RepID=UPI0032B2AF36